MDGILVVDKPSGMTSHDVVAFVRRRLRMKKVGHAGTLDPMATGVLVVLVGKLTKKSAKFSNHDKVYEGTLTLGVTTDTADSKGKVLSKGDVPKFNSTQIQDVFAEFLGEIEQVPPMVSAVKHNGRKLYELARKGVMVPRKPRKIKIHKLDITEIDLPDISFRVECSKGTYVRTLCEDIGMRLGCGGHQSKLRRTKSGPFTINDAVSLDQVSSGRLLHTGY